MENEKRNELVSLYKLAFAAATKVKRNADKLTFMSMTPAGRFAFEQYGHQLDAYAADSRKASELFAGAVTGLSVSEIVSIITEATQIEAAA